MKALAAQKFRARRVPGTVALAVTNLIAATVLVEPDTMTGNAVHRVALQLMSVWAWGALLLVAGTGLVAAAVTLRTWLLNAFGGLSIALWVGLSFAGFLSDLTDDSIRLSGLALALFVWMFLGPLAMLLVPLIAAQHNRGSG